MPSSSPAFPAEWRVACSKGKFVRMKRMSQKEGAAVAKAPFYFAPPLKNQRSCSALSHMPQVGLQEKRYRHSEVVCWTHITLRRREENRLIFDALLNVGNCESFG